MHSFTRNHGLYLWEFGAGEGNVNIASNSLPLYNLVVESLNVNCRGTQVIVGIYLNVELACLPLCHQVLAALNLYAFVSILNIASFILYSHIVTIF